MTAEMQDLDRQVEQLRAIEDADYSIPMSLDRFAAVEEMLGRQVLQENSSDWMPVNGLLFTSGAQNKTDEELLAELESDLK